VATRAAEALERIGAAAVARRRLVFAVAVIFTLVSGALGGNVIKQLSIGGFEASSSPAAKAHATLRREFGVDVPGLVLLVRVAGPDATDRAAPSAGAPSAGAPGAGAPGVDAPAVAAAGTALAARLAREPGIAHVESYWTAGPASRIALRGRNGRTALILADVRGNDDQVAKRVAALAPVFRGRHGPLVVGIAGLGELENATTNQVTKDLAKAEVISLPLVLIVLLLVFRGVVAALLPLAIGVLAILGTLLELKLMSTVTPVSVFAVNITTGLGLGLAIDYSLFIVSRYRRELRAGRDTADAIRATMRTAGRTVAFSAVTVAVSLAGLLVFPLYYLTSFAYAGIAVVILAAAAALLLLPAMLAALGPRIDMWSFGEPGTDGRASRAFGRFAEVSMRFPLPIVTAGVALLVFLGLPFLHARLGYSDDRNLPASVPVRQVSDEIRAQFPVRPDATAFVLVPRTGPGPALDAYALRLSRVRGVSAVQGPGGLFAHGVHIPLDPGAMRGQFARGDSSFLAVADTSDAYGASGQALARRLRAVPAPPGGATITGIAASILDTEQMIADRLPLALAVVVIATMVALLALTGSLLAPLKALVLNALSLTAVFGALVWIFQEGHLQTLVGGFTVTDSINVLNPPLMFCIAFGLSMDYEVLMLSRIKEEHDAGYDNTRAVARGLQAAGPLITAAAALMAIVFAAFSTSSVTNVKMIGVGMALAIVIDATIVRSALVPAIMRLAGRWNWWAPKGLAGRVLRPRRWIFLSSRDRNIHEPSEEPAR
jgi:RND superfamily putative drug exporter